MATIEKSRVGGSELVLPQGRITFTATESALFNQLFTVVDVDKTEAVDGPRGALFLRRSGLPTDQLREVWRLACGGVSKPALTRANWAVALKLVSVAQAKGSVSLDALFTDELFPLPNLQINQEPDLSRPTPLVVVPPGTITVGVTNPVVLGAALTKYVEYTVTTDTTLPQYSKKHMVVKRRFRDFDWLDDYLGKVYAGCLIPPLPAKQTLGTTDPAFVEQRRASLDNYLQRVARHPRLINAYALQVFLEASQEGLEAFKELCASGLAGGVPPEDAQTAGVLDSLWSSISSSLPATGAVVDVHLDEEFKAMCDDHERLHGGLLGAVKSASVLLRSRRDLGYEWARLGSYTLEAANYEKAHQNAGAAAYSAYSGEPDKPKDVAAAWSTADSAAFAGTAFGSGQKSAKNSTDFWAVEGEFHSNEAEAASLFEAEEDVFSGRGQWAVAPKERVNKKQLVEAVLKAAEAPREVQTIGQLLSSFGGTMENFANLYQDQLDKLQTVFFMPLRYEMEGAMAVQAAKDRRASVVTEVVNAQALLAACKKKYAAARADGAGAAKASAGMTKAESTITKAEAKLAAVTANLKVEMRARDAQRRSATSEMLLQFAKNEARHAAERAERWEELLRFVSRDPALVAASTARVAPVLFKPPVVPEPEKPAAVWDF